MTQSRFYPSGHDPTHPDGLYKPPAWVAGIVEDASRLEESNRIHSRDARVRGPAQGPSPLFFFPSARIAAQPLSLFFSRLAFLSAAWPLVANMTTSRSDALDDVRWEPEKARHHSADGGHEPLVVKLTTSGERNQDDPMTRGGERDGPRQVGAAYKKKKKKGVSVSRR